MIFVGAAITELIFSGANGDDSNSWRCSYDSARPKSDDETTDEQDECSENENADVDV
ncbi:hypothetical protein RHMOL_Rhmol11G0082900 [Rhododendron molle]|uniref:Uncharacterized protein n=1 Tax=Rhododendron molle TaxID=49168 RepID=A0ACC0LRG0_RHOML|nr:hypothetical protein RHMOL_Rhmol11G0082900 [Rhododendron molle]